MVQQDVFFWLFMLCMNVLIPFVMISFGYYFKKQAPKEINDIFGYRTTMSMKNLETWAFAHHYVGKLWMNMGICLLPIYVYRYVGFIWKR